MTDPTSLSFRDAVTRNLIKAKVRFLLEARRNDSLFSVGFNTPMLAAFMDAHLKSEDMTKESEVIPECLNRESRKTD